MILLGRLLLLRLALLRRQVQNSRESIRCESSFDIHTGFTVPTRTAKKSHNSEKIPAILAIHLRIDSAAILLGSSYLLIKFE